jgi:Trk K+ transport system NAD-binding subunit
MERTVSVSDELASDVNRFAASNDVSVDRAHELLVAVGLETLEGLSVEVSVENGRLLLDCPEEAGSRAVVNELLGGGVRSLESIGGDLEILDVAVAPDAPAAGRRLDSVHLPKGTLIIADAAGNRVSGADTVLEPGDRYLVAVEAAVNEEVMNLLRG